MEWKKVWLVAKAAAHMPMQRLPGKLEQWPPRPRPMNRWTERDAGAEHALPVVARVRCQGRLREDLARLVSALGPPPVRPGDRVLIKPSFNSPDPYPASTDPAFLGAVIDLVRSWGGQPHVADTSGLPWQPVGRVLASLGVDSLCSEKGVPLLNLEAGQWVNVRIPGRYLRRVILARAVLDAERVIYLANIKTHRFARFSGALKLAMGLVHPWQRLDFHLSHLEGKIAEQNLAVYPDLVIVDGRKAFVTGGPDSGDVVEPGVLLASGDLVAADLEALGILTSYRARNRLFPDPFRHEQIAAAIGAGLFPTHGRYVVKGDGNEP